MVTGTKRAPWEKAPNRGFTLIEVLVVVAVLGVLLAIALPLYQASQRDSELRACRANIIAIYQAEEAYRVRNRTYTTNIADLIPMLGGDIRCPTDNSGYEITAPPGTLITDSIKISCTASGNGRHTENPVYINGDFSPSPATQGKP